MSTQPAGRRGANASVLVIKAVKGWSMAERGCAMAWGQDVSLVPGNGEQCHAGAHGVMGHLGRKRPFPVLGAREVLTLYFLWPLNIRAIFRKFL